MIKILINYLLLFHREEISAYLIGITEMYSVPLLHKLNVKNKSTVCVCVCVKERKGGSKREYVIVGKICRWCKSGLFPQSLWMQRLRPKKLKESGCLLGFCAI